MAIQSIVQKSLTSSQNWVDVKYNATLGKFYAIANGTSHLMSSSDGITWSVNTTFMGSPWGWGCFAIKNAASPILAAYENSSQPGWAESNGGMTYMNGRASASSISGGFTRMEYLPHIDKFACIAANGGTSGTLLLRTPGSGVFTTSYIQGYTCWDWAYGNGIYVALPTSSSTARWCTTPELGTAWSAGTAITANNGGWTVTYGAGLFVAIGYSSSAYYTSSDGKNWTSRTLPVSSTWKFVRYGVNMFLVIADSGVALASVDGLTWTQFSCPVATYTGLTAGPSSFVAVSNGSVGLLTIHVKITGTVRDDTGALCARTVRCYDRATGVLADSTTSNATTGAFTLYPSTPNSCYVVALDDDAGTVLNALIYDRVVPA